MPPLPRPQMGNMLKFWRDRGSFNLDLYYRICRLKAEET